MNIQLVKKPSATLTKGQKDLYALITTQLANNKSLTYEQVKEIWLTKVCRDVRNGIPYIYEGWHHKDEKGEWHSGYTPMDEERIRTNVFVWLTANIGSLVIKGLLKVIPQLELTALE